MDEKTLLNAISAMLDERDQRLSAMMDSKLDRQTTEIKDYIRKNNVDIGEILTTALEASEERPKDTLYKIIPLRG